MSVQSRLVVKLKRTSEVTLFTKWTTFLTGKPLDVTQEDASSSLVSRPNYAHLTGIGIPNRFRPGCFRVRIAGCVPIRAPIAQWD